MSFNDEYFFDPTDVDTTAFSAILPGTYTACLVKLEDKDAKSGSGKYLNAQWEICSEGPFKGRSVFDIINYRNANEKAQEIGQRNLARIIVAKYGQKQKIKSPNELINAVLDIKVEQVHDDYKKELVNRITQYIVTQEDVPF